MLPAYFTSFHNQFREVNTQIRWDLFLAAETILTRRKVLPPPTNYTHFGADLKGSRVFDHRPENCKSYLFLRTPSYKYIIYFFSVIQYPVQARG